MFAGNVMSRNATTTSATVGVANTNANEIQDLVCLDKAIFGVNERTAQDNNAPANRNSL